jgi:2'-5' RNA ligase
VIYVLAYPRFDPDAATRIARFRLTNEPSRARLVAPHITLVFGVGPTHAADLIARSRDLAAQTRSFKIAFASAERIHDPFENAHKLFLICDTGAGTLTGLHNDLYAGLLRQELDPNHPFRPHMTVASHSDRAEIDRLDPGILGPLPITARITALDIVKVTNGTLETLATVPLLP